MRYSKSSDLFKKAKEVIPGGVNSPVRSFNSVGSVVIFAKSAQGALLVDEDDNEYIDYICSWGPLILGHKFFDDYRELAKNGITYGLSTKVEVELASKIVDIYSSIELVRMVNSGTEATMSALRLARGYTGKDKIIKFEGCYHGHSDGLLVKSGSGLLSNGVASSLGVSKSVATDTLVAEYNDLQSVSELLEKNSDIAAIIVEPIAGNMGLVVPDVEFLVGLRKLCDDYKVILIFDEVITGFRIAINGASGYYGVEADLICLGKIIGGGLPVGAYGGKKEIMECISPLGDVYQAGTLSGNPLAMTLGLKTVQYLKQHPEIYLELESKAIKLEKGFINNLKNLEIKNVTINRIGGMLCQFFVAGPVKTYQKVLKSNTKQYAKYFHLMSEQGILLPPSQFECMFLSIAHDDKLIDRTIIAHYESMKELKVLCPEL